MPRSSAGSPGAHAARTSSTRPRWSAPPPRPPGSRAGRPRSARPPTPVAGDGAERAELEALARELGLEARVRFAGARPRAEVLGLMRAADAVVLSSAWENFPHGLVEALAMGTPVVATRVGGVAEIVQDGKNGLLVEPGDPDAFADALRRLLGEPELRARLRAAAAPSVEQYDQDRV